MAKAHRPLLYGSRILQLAYGSGGVSRAEAAEVLGLDRATVTRVARDLIRRGLLTEEPEDAAPGPAEAYAEGPGRQGRRPIPLRVPDSCGCVLGLEVQGDFVKAGLVSPSGTVLGVRSLDRRRPKSGGTAAAESALVEDILRAAEAGRADARRRGLRVLGVGAALTGLVDAASGTLLFSMGLSTLSRPVPLREALEGRLGLPVMVDNDAKCCCYDALTFSSPPAERDFLYIFCEIPEDSRHPDRLRRISLGMSVVLDGRVQYGARFSAGEFRSVFADPAVGGQFGRRRPGYYRRIKSDPVRRSRFFSDLSRNVGFIANFLDLKEVRIGGGIEVYRDELLASFDEAVSAGWLYREHLPRSIPVRIADTEEKPALRGAAAMVLRRIFFGAFHPSGGAAGLEYLDDLSHREGQHRVDA